MDVDGEALEMVVGHVEPEHALFRAHIYALPVGQQCRDILVVAQLWYAVGLHLDAVVAAEAVVGSHPDEAAAVLHHAAHRVGGQPVVHCDAAIGGVGLGIGWQG